MPSIREWLEALGLLQYAAAFERSDVDLDVLLELTEMDLEQLGVTLGHRKKILRAVAQLDKTDGHWAETIKTSAVQPFQPRIESTTAEGERRQVTVLFTDLVGSTELSNRLDPEDYRRIITSVHEASIQAVQRYEGFVAQIQGDGLMAYFGYPLAHEAEADRAIRAAFAVQQAIAALELKLRETLKVRIGIATGLVVVSHILAPEKSASGDTPNLAHRLQSIARPGEIVVSARTRELAGGAFEYEDLGLHELKGVPGRARAWRVSGRSGAASRFEAATRWQLTPLVGREQELGLLLDRWELSREGEGQIVLLVGEPGIGKSRMISSLRERLGVRAGLALQYQCSPYYTNSAFYPLIDHLERALAIEPGESASSRLEKLERLMEGKWSRSRLDTHLVARLLSIPCDEHYGTPEMTPQRQKEETIRALVGTIETIAHQQSALLLFEDAHWADPTTLEVLDALIDRTRVLPLLILITFRPEFQPVWSSRSYVTSLSLSRLSKSQSTAIVQRVAGKPLPADLVAQIVDKTDGVPLFLEELTKAVLESNIVADQGERYEYSGSVDRMAVPATLRDSLMARLDRLIPVKEIAQIGAVLGREFTYELVASISPMEESELVQALNKLVASELVYRRGTPPNAVYIFKHALVQDAAYDSLLKAKRQELHGTIADVIQGKFASKLETEPELIAHHLTEAGRIGEAIPLWKRAGELALGRIALPEATRHLEKGLRLNQSLPLSIERDRAELGIRSVLGTAWMALRGWPAQEVVDALSPAPALAQALGDASEMVPISFGLWANVLVRGRIAESLTLAHEAMEQARSLGDENHRIVAHCEAMVSQFWLGNFLLAKEHGEQIRSLYRIDEHHHIVVQTNFDPLSAYGLYGGPWTWILGYPDQALQITLEKERHARQINHPYDLGFALTTGSHTFDYRCEAEELFQRVDEAERVGRDSSVPFIAEVMAQVMRGVALLRAGRPSEAVTQLDLGIGRWHAHGSNIWNPYIRSLQAEAMALTGDLDGAVSLLDNCIEQTQRPGWEERAHLAETLRLRAWALHQRGDKDQVEPLLREAIDVARGQQAKSWELRASTTLADVLAERGERTAALELLQPIYDWFTQGFDTRDLRTARTLLDQLQ